MQPQIGRLSQNLRRGNAARSDHNPVTGSKGLSSRAGSRSDDYGDGLTLVKISLSVSVPCVEDNQKRGKVKPSKKSIRADDRHTAVPWPNPTLLLFR
jgi:hypothetical protein